MGGMASFLRTAPALVLLAVALSALAGLPAAFVDGDAAPFTLRLLLVASALACFVAIPSAIVRFAYKERLAAYGIRLPERTRRTAMLSALALLAAVAPLPLLALRPEFKEFYALPDAALAGASLVLALAYYAAEEFFFRGPFLFALRARVGAFAVPVASLVFALLHAGKPPLEILYAAYLGAILSLLALRTGSFLPSAAVHWLAALALFALAHLA